MIAIADVAVGVLDGTQPTKEADLLDGLLALVYHRVPAQICYALARAEIRSLESVREQTREQLLAIPHIGTTGVTYIERALDAIDAAEAEDAIARDVYGCRAGRRCRIATAEQRVAFDRMISARMRGWRATHPPRSGR